MPSSGSGTSSKDDSDRESDATNGQQNSLFKKLRKNGMPSKHFGSSLATVLTSTK